MEGHRMRHFDTVVIVEWFLVNFKLRTFNAQTLVRH